MTVYFTGLSLLQTIQRRQQGTWWMVNWMWFGIRLHYSENSYSRDIQFVSTKGHKIHVRLAGGTQEWKTTMSGTLNRPNYCVICVVNTVLNVSNVAADRTTRRDGSRLGQSYINKIQQDATLCGYLFTTKLLSTFFGCPSHPSSGVHKTVTAACGTGHSIWATIFLQRGLIRPRWRKVVAVPEAAVTVLCTPDDGCDGHPKYVEWFCSK